MVSKMDKDIFRENLIKYTRKAFQMLPRLANPSILDIGCGSGVPTMELARLSNGQIIGVDIDQSFLDTFARKIEQAGLSDRVNPVKCSMIELDFPDETFDIIWSEGSISQIGFKRGLKEWRRFLNPRGFLVVHHDMKNMTENLEQISGCGYSLLGHFELSGDVWWNEYYGPLEEHINKIRAKCGDPEALSTLDSEQREIDMVKKNPSQYGSVFFIMEKTTSQ